MIKHVSKMVEQFKVVVPSVGKMYPKSKCLGSKKLRIESEIGVRIFLGASTTMYDYNSFLRL